MSALGSQPLDSARPKATRREWIGLAWIGLAVIALPCLVYAMDLTVLWVPQSS